MVTGWSSISHPATRNSPSGAPVEEGESRAVEDLTSTSTRIGTADRRDGGRAGGNQHVRQLCITTMMAAPRPPSQSCSPLVAALTVVEGVKIEHGHLVPHQGLVVGLVVAVGCLPLPLAPVSRG